ncbi:uncharacterized protein METZ01_LOCUS266043, partial [marine metagenome]
PVDAGGKRDRDQGMQMAYLGGRMAVRQRGRLQAGSIRGQAAFGRHTGEGGGSFHPDTRGHGSYRMAPTGTLVQGSQDKKNRRRPDGSTEDADRKGNTEPRRGSCM